MNRERSGVVATLFPGYFALVMATGIVAVDVDNIGWEGLAKAVLAVAAIGYAVLWVLTILRLVWHPRLVVRDLGAPGVGAGFLTMVAGTNVLGSATALIMDTSRGPRVLWYVGIGLWFLLLYGFLFGVTLREPKPDFQTGFNPGWLLLVVSTQSVSVLASVLARDLPQPFTSFVALAAALLGLAFYIVIVTFVIQRLLFFPVDWQKLPPSHWIDLGAVAITAVALSRLVGSASVPGVYSLVPELNAPLKGLALLAWVLAAWWLPFVVLLGVWRHVGARVPLRYDPQYWAMVFPIAMFALASRQVGAVADVPVLRGVSTVVTWFAVAVWATVLAGLLASLVRGGAAQARR